MPGAITAIGSWVFFLGGLLFLNFRAWLREQREDQRSDRLRRMGDEAWRADERAAMERERAAVERECRLLGQFADTALELEQLRYFELEEWVA